jgi:DNA-binding NarL/FixJ family response regulator
MPLVVLVLSTSGEEADIAAAYRFGANGFLVKPAQASKLVEMVKAIKDFWLTHNTQPKDSAAPATAAGPARSSTVQFPAKPWPPMSWAAVKSETTSTQTHEKDYSTHF